MIKKYVKHPKVSIIILVKDALKYVDKCLKSLNKYTNNYELILVDNNSKKPTKDYLKKLDWFDYTLITNKGNKGFAYGCNQAISVATTDYSCFLNSDTVLSENWLGKMMKAFALYNDVGIVGPSTCHSTGSQHNQKLSNIRFKATQEKINQIAFSMKEEYVFVGVVGFCWIIKKEVFDKIGYFDWKRYGIATHEDIDFLWRANRTGFRSCWAKASYVHHYGNRSTLEMGLNPTKIRIDNKPKFLARKRSETSLYVENGTTVENVKKIKGKIPILMISYNRLGYTKKAVDSIVENTSWPYELFIFDNGSKAPVRDYLKTLEGNSNIKIHLHKTNSGLVFPINTFFKRYQNYRYVAKVDNDTIVSEDWLGKLKEVMDIYPFFVLQADHYLMLKFRIKTNDDFYKHLYSLNFGGSKLYISKNGGGTGILIRRQVADRPIESVGGLGGWLKYQYQISEQWKSAFYTGVWVDRLDQVATNKYKTPPDYPAYDRIIKKLRSRGTNYETIPARYLENLKRDMQRWWNTDEIYFKGVTSGIVIRESETGDYFSMRALSTFVGSNKMVKRNNEFVAYGRYAQKLVEYKIAVCLGKIKNFDPKKEKRPVFKEV